MKQHIREQLQKREQELNMADQPQPNFTQAQFLEMMQTFLAQQSEANQKNMIAFAKELKEPDDYTKEKQTAQRKREMEERVGRMRQSIDGERQKEKAWFHCRHIKISEGVMKESHAFVGQVNNDSFFRPICCRCYTPFPRVRASDEQIRNGVSLKAVPNLNLKIVLGWHLHTDKNCKECAKGLCAKKMLRQIEQGFLDAPLEVLPNGKVSAESVLQELQAAAAAL